MLPYQVRRWFRWSEWRWLCRRFVGFFQRGWRGYADHDVWSFDHYVAGVMSAGLKRLAANHCGYPTAFLPDYPTRWEHTLEEREAAYAAWTAWLEDKAEWFAWYAVDDDGISDDRGWIRPDLTEDEKRRRIEAHLAKMETFHSEVLADFGEHFGSLWD